MLVNFLKKTSMRLILTAYQPVWVYLMPKG